LALADGRLTQHGKQAVVKLGQLLIDGFVGAPPEVGRDSYLSSRKLALVEEAQARRQERDCSRGLVHPRRERRRSPGLVVVFQEAGQPVLVVQPRVEMLAHGTGMTLAEA